MRAVRCETPEQLNGPGVHAFAVESPGPIDSHPLRLIERPPPEPGPSQVRVRVRACGVCRTDLHLAEGDLPPQHRLVTPGHEIVGVVDRLGSGARRFRLGDRIGIAWLARTCGACRFCVTGRENLCVEPLFTGWHRDGGYGEYVLADEDFAYALPDELSDERAAPLLCAGIIGARALARAELPDKGRLGIYGFGASAHLCLQLALDMGARVHVISRSPAKRALAIDLGAASAHGADGRPPEALDSAILFAPAGELVAGCLAALERGGRLVVAGIHLSEIPPLSYDAHLSGEKILTSVTANTRKDGTDFLQAAMRIDIEVSTAAYPMLRANEALLD
ncbi:MAG: zinc-dependent alcohol dehydrogenase family protein, partial [Acidimicrobiales bacterium]